MSQPSKYDLDLLAKALDAPTLTPAPFVNTLEVKTIELLPQFAPLFVNPCNSTIMQHVTSPGVSTAIPCSYLVVYGDNEAEAAAKLTEVLQYVVDQKYPVLAYLKAPSTITLTGGKCSAFAFVFFDLLAMGYNPLLESDVEFVNKLGFPYSDERDEYEEESRDEDGSSSSEFTRPYEIKRQWAARGAKTPNSIASLTPMVTQSEYAELTKSEYAFPELYNKFALVIEAGDDGPVVSYLPSTLGFEKVESAIQDWFNAFCTVSYVVIDDGTTITKQGVWNHP
jgi:hypothetical protein